MRAGAGVNTIDVKAASERGITVANCPGKNAVAVAELVFGLILAIDRRIPEATALLRDGHWCKTTLATGRGLLGRTLAVIGTGTIGRAVIARAQAFGMRTTAWSRSLTTSQAESLGVTACNSPIEAAAAADAVSVHLAATPDTRGFIGRAFFETMRPGSTFINTSRGTIVDQAALLEAMTTRDLKAGLDVFDPEPGAGESTFTDAIRTHPNLVATHHLGASTTQATTATAMEALRVIRGYLELGEAPNSVNVRHYPESPHGLVVQHRDQVGTLVGVLEVLKEAHFNVKR